MAGEIQGTLAVEDVTADGALDIIAADASGNVVCVSAAGEIQWEQRISGFSSQGATIGDVDGAEYRGWHQTILSS